MVHHHKFAWNGYLEKSIKVVLERAIPNRWDCLLICFGKEGSGKTTFATQLAIELDPTFDLSRCVFTGKQFDEAIEAAQPEQAIVWDEAIMGANVDTHGSQISITIISKLTQIRKKRLKIILCFPYLYKLNKYFISRCLGSFYVYAKAFDDRGYAKFYSSKRTELMYDLIKEKYRYSHRRVLDNFAPSFFTRFNGVFVLPEDKYDDKKEEARKSEDKVDKRDLKWKDRIVILLTYLRDKTNISQETIASLWGVDRTFVSHISRDAVTCEASISN